VGGLARNEGPYLLLRTRGRRRGAEYGNNVVGVDDRRLTQTSLAPWSRFPPLSSVPRCALASCGPVWPWVLVAPPWNSFVCNRVAPFLPLSDADRDVLSLRMDLPRVFFQTIGRRRKGFPNSTCMKDLSAHHMGESAFPKNGQTMLFFY
jgi:hypothetical protein